jgi:dTDP-4-amino-4,6-dideoxygalactose transaminase
MKTYVTKPSLPPLEEFLDMVREVSSTGILTNGGPLHERLTRELRDRLGAPFFSLFTNGHLALECIIEALQLKGEVITTPFTFASTTHAIVRKGLTPVFCDIDSVSCTMDVSKIEALITGKTTAILPVHVYGVPCNVEVIESIAEKYGLKVIYDAAHAFGVRYKGVPIGRFGDASMFSFHATKVFHTVEGGGVSTRDEGVNEQLKLLRNFGIAGPSSVVSVGGNAKMDELRAAVGLCNLRHFEREVERRAAVSARYDANLLGMPGVRVLKNADDVMPNYAYYPVWFDPDVGGWSRDEALAALAKEGVFARAYFFPTTNSFECYQGVFQPVETPIADRVSRMVLTLPLYADLALAEVDRICGILRERG